MKSQLGEKVQKARKILKGLFHLLYIKEDLKTERKKKKKKGSELQKTLGSNTGAKFIIQQAAPPAYTHSSIR